MLGIHLYQTHRGPSPHQGAHPLKIDVDIAIPCEAALPRVNVPNHVRSHWLKNESWPICSKLTAELPHGKSNIP